MRLIWFPEGKPAFFSDVVEFVAKAGQRNEFRLPLNPGVRVVGSLLAGQRYLRERCGDGVAIASALVAARSLAGPTASSGRRAERVSAAAGRIR